MTARPDLPLPTTYATSLTICYLPASGTELGANIGSAFTHPLMDQR